MTTATPVERFRRNDWLGLAALSLLLFAAAGFSGRAITTHEAVHCQNVREMLADQDWVIPHYGGRVWLERPPLPHWATAAVVAASGAIQSEWPYRLAAAFAGAFVTVLIGWIGSVWYGRGIGWLAGGVFATCRLGFGYATGAEADIFLAAIVTAATALFVRTEFVPATPERTHFLGLRRWDVLALFVLLGLTNMAKGLFFGMALAGIPMAGYVLAKWSRTTTLRYVWLWGWLAFALAATAWPLAAYLREPGVLDLWKSDYIGRLNNGFMREPIWYYVTALPWSLFPWTIPALLGFGLILGKAREAGSPERFLLLWAVLPIAFLSVPQGKHHHYLLPVAGPWCVFSAVAAERVWAWLRSLPRWLRHPLTTAIPILLLLSAGAIIFRERLAAPQAALVAIVLLTTVCAGLFRWFLDHPRRVMAAAGSCVFFGLASLVFELGTAAYADSYRFDRAFVDHAQERIGPDEPLFVMNDYEPLDSSWMLFYMPARAQFLHNPTFLNRADLPETGLWVLGRGHTRPQLTHFGRVEDVLSSERSRALKTAPEERWTLYRVHLRADRWQVPPESVRVTPMQATGRADGPYLLPPPPEPPAVKLADAGGW